MPQATLGIVGLREAGKTVLHVTLYGRPIPLDWPEVTLGFPPSSQRILEDLWQKHSRGEKLDPTALTNHIIEWEFEHPVSGVEWKIRTMDAGGEFYSSLRAADVDAVAGPVDNFLMKCDAILYLIDASDESLLPAQLGALRQVLTFNKRRVRTGSGLKSRPIGLVFTKADTYIPGFHELDLKRARTALTSYLLTSDAGQQLLAFYSAYYANGGDLYETFPISCLRHDSTRFRIVPRWIHNPILWAVQQVGAARAGRRWARMRVVTGILTLLAACGVGAWVYGRSEANRLQCEVEAWCDAHPGGEQAKAREEKRRELAAHRWISWPFVTRDRIKRDQQAIESEVVAHYEHILTVLRTQLSNFPGDANAQDRIRILDGVPFAAWDPRWRASAEELRADAVRSAYRHRYTALCAQLDNLPGKSNAAKRRGLIESAKWTSLPDTIPADFKADLDQRLRVADEEEQDFVVKQILFTALDELREPDDAQKAVEMLISCKFRNGLFKNEIQERLDHWLYVRVRQVIDTKDDALPGICLLFLKECPDSPRKNAVQLAHGEWAWERAEGSRDKAKLSYEARIQKYEDYLAIEYGTRKESARRAVDALRTAWDKDDYEQIHQLIPLRSWANFEEAKKLGMAYLASSCPTRARREKVDSFLKALAAFENGVDGLELKIDQVNLSDARDLLPDSRPKAVVYINRTLPQFNAIRELKEQEYPYFKLAKTNEHRPGVKYISGFKMFSGENQKFDVVIEVVGTSGYVGFSTKPFRIDFGDDLFSGKEGTTKRGTTHFVGTRRVEVEFVIHWKGSNLSDLTLPAYGN